MPSKIKETKKILVIYDFDWSLIDEDSDSYVFKELYPDLHEVMNESLGKMQFTDLVDHMLGLMQSKPDFNLQKLKDCLSTIPFHEDMLKLMEECRLSTSIMDLLIISDANSFYIEQILRAYRVFDLFQNRIITNPAKIDESGRLRVQRLIKATDDQHNCINKCAVNICKGRELKLFLEKSDYSYKKMIYVGDSKNDLCPSLHLGPEDLVLARKGRSLESLLTESHDIRSKLQAKLHIWSDGSDVYRLVKSHMT